MGRAMSVAQLLRQKKEYFEFEGKWFDAFERPETCGSWIVWGGSGSGKTTFMLQLAKYLSGFKRVLYNSLEEGDSLSFQNAIRRVDLEGSKVQFVCEPIEEMVERLRKRKSPDVVIIDTIQYCQMNQKEYMKLLRPLTKHKLLIFNSHEVASQPDGRTAIVVKRDAMLKIRVEGFRAFSQGRFKGVHDYFTINEKLANGYWHKKEVNYEE